MTYQQPAPWRRYNQASADEAFKARAALFPPERPSKIALQGSVSIPVDQLEAFMSWLVAQQPDGRGNVSIRLVFYEDSVKATGQPYLSGYLQPFQQAPSPNGRPSAAPRAPAPYGQPQAWAPPAAPPPQWQGPPQWQAQPPAAPPVPPPQAVQPVAAPQAPPVTGVQPPAVQSPTEGDSVPF